MTRYTHIVIASFFLLPFFITPSFAQYDNLEFERISIEQGLSVSTVTSIIQDIRGFMWFGTEDGLNKYDGYSFTVYKQDPQDLQSLSGNNVRSIYEDQAGVLWIGTFGGGLNKFDREKDTFTRYKYDPNDPKSLSDNRVISIYEDQSGMLWIGTRGGGLNKFDQEKETFTRYKYDPDDPQSLSNNIVFSIYEDQSGVLWIGTIGGGLNKLVPSDNEESPPTFVHYKQDPNDPQSLSDNRAISIYEDQTGVLWIGTYGSGLNKLVPGINEESPPTFVQYKQRISINFFS